MKICRRIFMMLMFFSASSVFALSTAQDIKSLAMQKKTVDESISYIHSSIGSAASDADRRSLYYFVGTLEELTGHYDSASSSYAAAAGIAAGDAKGMPKVSTEQLVLDAVRCSLNCGDYSAAQSYLNSSVRSSKDERILSRVNLYSVWADLCRAQTVQEISGPVSTLKQYELSKSMQSVRPAVLLTLWYITGSSEYAEKIKKSYPSSPEAGIVNGRVDILSVPFWYFVPRAVSEVEPASSTSSSSSQGTKTTASSSSSSATKTTTSSSSSSGTKTSSTSAQNTGTKKVREQLGLFRSKANADTLIQDLKAKGFQAYSYTETRASGTTYYIVVVDENSEGSMGKKLRSAGFDCYPVEY